MNVPDNWPEGFVWQARDFQNRAHGPLFVKWKGREYVVGDDGHLLDTGAWDSNWVEYVMWSEDIVSVSRKHHEIIMFIRNYFLQFSSVPLLRVIIKNLDVSLSEIYELFPSGPAKGACRAAGIPRPSGCLN